ncbi:hypothetical protein PCAR4_360079 [Paraburkholderia caribensis]|nr:hypothetical protein PCAR4_360079 [Paraburkholderia caribensis]
MSALFWAQHCPSGGSNRLAREFMAADSARDARRAARTDRVTDSLTSSQNHAVPRL